jgi:hypothetical protein
MYTKTSGAKSKTLLSILVLSVGCLILLSSSMAEAQYRSRGHARGHGHVSVAFFPPGVYAGAGLVATKILSQHGGEELLDNGAGLSLFMGIRLNPRLALEGGVTSTFHNPQRVQTAFGDDIDYLVLNAATVDAKVFFPNGNKRLVPFAQGGLGLYLLDSDYFGTQSVGTGFQLGGGFDYRLGPAVEFGLRALYRGISMGPPETNLEDTFISALSAEANIALRF